MLKLTPELCKYLEDLGLPVFITPSTNNETEKIEIAMYIYDIEQNIVDGKETVGKIQEIFTSMKKLAEVP